jgi:acyl-CoA reductase-like NAD-dependent aldehyde dehydrogenase
MAAKFLLTAFRDLPIIRRMSTITISASRVDDLVTKARAAQQSWWRLSVSERVRPVRALRHLLATEYESLCDAVARDIGKPAEETLGGDVLPLAEACRYLERRAARLLAPRRVSSGVRPLWMFGQVDAIHRRPRGVVGIIGTWNYPLFLNGVQIVQATTAGNAVVWKPSEVAPSSATALINLIEKAGFPKGLIQCMDATREGGPALAEADVDHVVFTGHADTGRRLAKRLGERLVSSTLELSGCDAEFVLEDADVELAARAAWFGATVNRGQTCLAVRRAFVQRANYPAFCENIRALSASAQPMQLALPAAADQAERLVRDALAGGGRLACEPPPTDPAVPAGSFRPAAILDAKPEMAICREAAFAPVIAVLPFDDLEDAVAMEAQCPYALGASVFTRDGQRAEALASRLRTGVVAINDVIATIAHPATPFGGRGISGWGVTQGPDGLLEMTIPQVVSRKSGRFRPHYDMSFDLSAGRSKASHGDLMRGLLESGHAPNMSTRMRGWRRLFSAVRGMGK